MSAEVCSCGDRASPQVRCDRCGLPIPQDDARDYDALLELYEEASGRNGSLEADRARLIGRVRELTEELDACERQRQAATDGEAQARNQLAQREQGGFNLGERLTIVHAAAVDVLNLVLEAKPDTRADMISAIAGLLDERFGPMIAGGGHEPGEN